MVYKYKISVVVVEQEWLYLFTYICRPRNKNLAVLEGKSAIQEYPIPAVQL